MWWSLAQDPASPLETTSWLGSIGSFVLAVPATLLSVWAFRLSWKQQREQQRQATEASWAMHAVVAELRAIASAMESRDPHHGNAWSPQATPHPPAAFATWEREEATDPRTPVLDEPLRTEEDENEAAEPLPAGDFGVTPPSAPTSGYPAGHAPPPPGSAQQSGEATQYVPHVPPYPGKTQPTTLVSLANDLAHLGSNVRENSVRAANRQRGTIALAVLSAVVALSAFAVGLLNLLP